MKKYLYLVLIFWLCPALTANANDLKVLDAFNTNELPKNYRSTNQLHNLKNKNISTIGLIDLKASGSAQFLNVN